MTSYDVEAIEQKDFGEGWANRVIESANAPVIGVDRDLKVTLWNRKTEQVTGYTTAK